MKNNKIKWIKIEYENGGYEWCHDLEYISDYYILKHNNDLLKEKYKMATELLALYKKPCNFYISKKINSKKNEIFTKCWDRYISLIQLELDNDDLKNKYNIEYRKNSILKTENFVLKRDYKKLEIENQKLKEDILFCLKSIKQEMEMSTDSRTKQEMLSCYQILSKWSDK